FGKITNGSRGALLIFACGDLRRTIGLQNDCANASRDALAPLRTTACSPGEALSLLAQRTREYCPNCQATVLAGNPVDELISLARDLIVIGSRHQAGFLGRLFAPDQERKMIHRAPCPVLICQGPP